MSTVRKTENAVEELVVFKLLEQNYAIDISTVHEIIRMEHITRVPRTPHFVEGVINLRGKIVPVIDLKKRFGLTSEVEATADSRIIIVEVEGTTIGIIVDGVREVLRLPQSEIEPTPPVLNNDIDATYIRGVGKFNDWLIVLLEIKNVLNDTNKENLNNPMVLS